MATTRFNRRGFVRTLGASAVWPALSHVGASPEAATAEPSNTTRSRVDLNGAWERRIDGELYDVVTVPSSLRPSGFYQRDDLGPHTRPHRRRQG